MPQTLKKQALTLTIANGFTRGLGFLFRLMTARLMGAEAIGVMELSASAAMLALTPATAGLPTAMSRMTARPNADQSAVLRAGLSLNRRIALVMMPLLFLLAPGMAWLLSDFRTLPAILISIPAVFLLGCCAVYSGWFYGRGDMLTPAQCECSEQIVRFVGSLVLLLIFTRSPLSIRAALPGSTRYGVQIQGATEIALTKLDVLSYMKEIPVCVQYEIHGQKTEEFPFTAVVDEAKPVFTTMPGWGCDISSVRKWEDLPVEARNYVEYIEKAIGCRISYVSVGAARDEYIQR